MNPLPGWMMVIAAAVLLAVLIDALIHSLDEGKPQ